MFVTKNGIVKRTPLDDLSNIRKSGVITINLKEGDELISVKITDGNQKLVIVTQNGYAITFDENDVRCMGRSAAGVKGITLREGDIAIGAEVADINSELLVVSENGFGKRTKFTEYTVQGRGGKGLITYKVTSKTGNIVGAKTVTDSDELMIINSNGIIIRLEIKAISKTGRNTLGVTLMKTHGDEKIVSIAKININDDDDEEILDENK
jgi:DNA gyrase subunit A